MQAPERRSCAACWVRQQHGRVVRVMSKANADDGKRTGAVAHLGAVPADYPKCPQDRGFAECPCPDDCSIQGECGVCTAFHLQQGRLPFCQRPASKG